MNDILFRRTQLSLEFSKNADSIGDCVRKYPFDCLKFVWRQAVSAFFSALTPVGALFIFGGRKIETLRENLGPYCFAFDMRATVCGM